MGSRFEDLPLKLLLQLGQSLELATREPAWTLRDVAALCGSVAPAMVQLHMAVAETGASALLECLQLLLDQKIPASLVKFMTISLHAGYPMGPPFDIWAAKESCAFASKMWALSSKLYRDILLACQTHPGEPYYDLCKAVVDQLQPLTYNGDPGEELYLPVSG